MPYPLCILAASARRLVVRLAANAAMRLCGCVVACSHVAHVRRGLKARAGVKIAIFHLKSPSRSVIAPVVIVYA